MKEEFNDSDGKYNYYQRENEDIQRLNDKVLHADIIINFFVVVICPLIAEKTTQNIIIEPFNKVFFNMDKNM